MTALTFAQANKYLDSRAMFGMDFGLDRMYALMARLGDPQLSYRTVHVVGTNGKSSTTQIVAELLETQGEKVGAYTSPHVKSFSERICVQGSEIQHSVFTEAVATVRQAAIELEAERSDLGSVTQFELLTAVAFKCFQLVGVDTAVIEAGLGARYDATSVIDPAVHILTSVALEHTDLLGETVEEIAAEKLATLKEGSVLVVSSALDPAAAEVVEQCCKRVGAKLVVADQQTASVQSIDAPFLKQNFALAQVAVSSLNGELASIVASQVASELKVPGRFEVVSESPLTVLDVAHNPAAIEQLIEALQTLGGFDQRIAVVSILKDKNAKQMLDQLAGYFDTLMLTECSSSRALTVAELTGLVDSSAAVKVLQESDVELAYDKATKLANPSDLLTVTGTNHIAALFH